MPDFDPNVAASIAAENTFQASQERPAAFERELADLIAWAEKAQSFGPGDFVKLHRLAFLAKTAAK